MLWDTLIKKVERFIEDRPEDAGSQVVLALSRITGKGVSNYLASFEPHEVTNLHKIIPNGFPRPLRLGSLISEKNIHGAWRIRAVVLTGAK